MSMHFAVKPAPFVERRRPASLRLAMRPASRRALPSGVAVVCFSHLRWNFVYQRPQHLMSRLAQHNPVFYVEEPVPTDGEAHLDVIAVGANTTVVVPRLPSDECGCGHPAGEARERRLLAELLATRGVERPICWFYTPMMHTLADGLDASLVVYDCMDELSAFHGAPPQMLERERALMARADLVFTGGHSLFEAKREAHAHVHAFPSSVDVPHFAAGRSAAIDPPDLADIPHPRIGFYGVIDERLDIALLADVVRARPDWHWVLIGPVVKIDPAALPRAANLHYLGAKRYDELPQYLGRWDVAMMPFAMNASTRYISPTKTPEYLAGGCPVVSTPITDVVRGYGDSGLVHIAADAPSFVDAVQAALVQRAAGPHAVAQAADVLLRNLSWQRTCADMTDLMAERLQDRRATVRRFGAATPATTRTAVAVRLPAAATAGAATSG